MATYTTEMRIFIVKEFYLNQKSPILEQRKFRKEFDCRNAPSNHMIYDLVKKNFNIPNSVLNDVIDNFQVWLRHIHNENGWHIEHILS